MELKHGYYHLIAILVVAIWGLTFHINQSTD